MGLMSFVADRLTNVMSGLGTTIDRRTSSTHIFNLVTTEQAEAAYRGGWLGRKIVDIPPLDMTREWRAWQAKDDQIELLEEEEKRLQLQQKCKRALVLSRLFGGGALLLGTGDPDPMQELDPEKVKKEGLRYVRVMSRTQLSLGMPRLDPEDPWVDYPEHFEIRTGLRAHQRQKIHPSRIIPFIGQQAPEGCYHRGEDWFWGDSIFQSISDAVDNAETAQAGFAALIDGSALDILKMPDLTEIASTAEGEAKITARLSATMLGKSTWRALLLDGEDEWDQRQINWAGIPDVLMTFLEIVSGAADIPVTRLLGQSPKGLQSTGDGEERDYHSMIKARQDELLLPALERIDELLIRSALGSRPDEIYFEFNPLGELSEKDAAAVDKQTADTLKVYGDTGLIHEEALAEIARNKMIETGRWPGCEAAFQKTNNALAEGPDEEELLAQANAIAKMSANPPDPNDPRKKRISANDATPRSLYVRRNLKNSGAFLAWARAQGFKSTVPAGELHVTVLFSRAQVDWLKMGNEWSSSDDGELKVAAGGPRIVEPLGDKGAVVLLFGSTQLSWRHEQMVKAGASHDFDDYQPHVTITYAGSDVDLESVEPYRGELIFGPEIFEEVDDDWSSKLIETGSKKKTELGDFNPHHVASGEHGGEFTSGSAASGDVVHLNPQTKQEELVAPNEGKTLAELHASAVANQHALTELGEQLEAETGIDFQPPPKGFEVKTMASIERKIRDEGYEGPHQITDMSRASFVVESPEQADVVVSALSKRGKVYDKGWVKLDEWGYGDRKLYLKHADNGVSEIQIVPKGVQMLKAGQGHQLYEVARLKSTPIEVVRAAKRKSRTLFNRTLRASPFRRIFAKAA